MSIPGVDGLSTDPRDLGRHNKPVDTPMDSNVKLVPGQWEPL